MMYQIALMDKQGFINEYRNYGSAQLKEALEYLEHAMKDKELNSKIEISK